MDRRSITSRENLKKIDVSKNRRPPGSKSKSTLLKEQAVLDMKERMIQMLTPEWSKLVQILITKALTETDVRALKIAIEQAVGTPQQEIRHDVSIEKMDKLSGDIKGILERKEEDEEE